MYETIFVNIKKLIVIMILYNILYNINKKLLYLKIINFK